MHLQERHAQHLTAIPCVLNSWQSPFIPFVLHSVIFLMKRRITALALEEAGCIGDQDRLNTDFLKRSFAVRPP